MSMKFHLLIETKLPANKEVSCFSSIMLIKVKMPTIDCIFTFMSGINFVLSSVEHVKSFITVEPGPEVIKVVSCLTQLSIKLQFLIETK